MKTKMTAQNETDIKKLLKTLEANEDNLSQNAIYFVRSVKKYYIHKKSISDKQLKCLKEIKNSINVCSVTAAT